MTPSPENEPCRVLLIEVDDRLAQLAAGGLVLNPKNPRLLKTVRGIGYLLTEGGRVGEEG